MKCVNVFIIYMCLISLAYSAPPLNFERDVLPVFKKSCFKCHSAETKKPKAGLRMDLKKELLSHEELIVPGKPQKSTLYTLMVLPAGHDDIMPPENKAPEPSKKEIEKVRVWIEQGAHFGSWTEYKSDSVKQTVSGLREKKKASVNFSDAVKNIDEIIKDSLKENKLKMNSKADHPGELS